MAYRMRVFALIAALGVVFTSSGVFAQETVSSLTDENVRAFIERTTDITSGRVLYMTDEEIEDYLDHHLDKKGFFRSTIKFNVPGFPSQENTLSLDKKQFIDSVMSGQQALQDYETTIEVRDVQISSSGNRATVKTVGIESGVMPVPTETGTQEYIPVDGQSTCDQILKLKKKVIQMYSANCTTEITFQSTF